MASGGGQRVRDDQGGPYWVEALARGLAVLRAFDAEHPSLSLSELAQRLGWSRTTPYRFVRTLERLGYLQRDEVTGRYRLGSYVLSLGFSYLHGLSLPDLAQPVLERLRHATRASAHLAIREGGDIVYLAVAPLRQIGAVTNQVGWRLPAHATSIGKVLLACSASEEVERLLSVDALPALTEQTVVDPVRFRGELARIRERGYTATNQEYALGVRSVGAPVFDAAGDAVAGINASAMSVLFTDDVVRGTVVPAVCHAAAELSACLGYTAERGPTRPPAGAGPAADAALPLAAGVRAHNGRHAGARGAATARRPRSPSTRPRRDS